MKYLTLLRNNLDIVVCTLISILICQYLIWNKIIIILSKLSVFKFEPILSVYIKGLIISLTVVLTNIVMVVLITNIYKLISVKK